MMEKIVPRLKTLDGESQILMCSTSITLDEVAASA
jgi:hypothetical protein